MRDPGRRQREVLGPGFRRGLGYGDTQNRGDGGGEMGDNLPSVDLGSGRSAKFIAAGGFTLVRSWTTAA